MCFDIFTAFFEPTDMRIATKPFNLPKHLYKQIKFISPNIYELNSIAIHLGCDPILKENDGFDMEKLLQNDGVKANIKKSACALVKIVDNVIITLGSKGVLITRKNTPLDSKFFNINLIYNRPINSLIDDIHHRFYEAQKLTLITNVSGAGDSFDVGFITAMINSLDENICVSVGIESAKAALQSSSPVPHKFFGRDHKCFYQPTAYKKF